MQENSRWKILKRRGHVGYLSVDGRILLKCILNKYGLWAPIGLNKLRIVSSSRIFSIR
jgi:hypothetical protein